MTSILLKGAPISFILLFLGIYVLGVFLYFLFRLPDVLSLSSNYKKVLEIEAKNESFEEIIVLAAPQIQLITKHLQFLRLVVNLAPLLGLLGTVLGIVKSTGGLISQDQNALLLGISQSLISTALGLIVSIPALLVHFFGKTRLESQILKARRKFYERSMD